MAAAATLALIRFREADVSLLPSDEVGSLADLNVDTGLTLPPVVSAFTGFGRAFSNGAAVDALDIVPGATLATRDVTVRVLVSWDIVAQGTYGQNGTIVARGKGGSAAEYVAYAVELRVVNAALGIGELRFWWQDTAGAVKTQLGGQFVAPVAGSFMLLTAVRHWVSSTQVELRYYAGDRLIGDFISPDGDIGGGTTGTFCVGTRYSGGAAARFLCGVLDELQVLNYEVTGEETAATWDRMARWQPAGYRAVRDLLPPGLPISNDPSSRIQKLLRITGHALGYAAAQVENFRRNILPDRAYGAVLEQWERAVGEAPREGDSIARRRRRVVAHLRQHAGSSVPGVAATVAELLAINATQVQVLAFDQTTTEDFASGLNALRWRFDPAANWTVPASSLRCLSTGVALPFDGTTRTWATAVQAMGGEGRAAHVLAKLVPTTVASGAEVGVVFYGWATGDAVLFGLRNTGGTYTLVIEVFRGWASSGVVTAATIAFPAAIWLHLAQVDPGGGGAGFSPGPAVANYAPAWSTTSAIAGYTTAAPQVGSSRHQWAGMYARTIGGAANLDVAWDDVILRAPFGDRSSRWYVYRDPALPGSPDIGGAHGAIQRLKHAHTAAAAVTTKILLFDDPSSGFDRNPMGGF